MKSTYSVTSYCLCSIDSRQAIFLVTQNIQEEDLECLDEPIRNVQSPQCVVHWFMILKKLTSYCLCSIDSRQAFFLLTQNIQEEVLECLDEPIRNVQSPQCVVHWFMILKFFFRLARHLGCIPMTL